MNIFDCKPIIFNAEMLQEAREGRKTVTRRTIKPQPEEVHKDREGWLGWYDGQWRRMIQPYMPGDILYAPEPWRCVEWYETTIRRKTGYTVEFKDGERRKFYFYDRERAAKFTKYGDKPKDEWQSPYFMPREAARLFLRVTDVRVERLHDVTEEQAIAEGARYTDFGVYTPSWKMSLDGGKTFHSAKPLHHPGYHFKEVTGPDQCFESARSAFANYWGRTIKPKDLDLYCWAANPWVWVIEFEGVRSLEEAGEPAGQYAADAVKIIDPKTRDEALEKYGADYRAAVTEEACAVLVRDYERQTCNLEKLESMIVGLMKPWMAYTLEKLKEAISAPESVEVEPPATEGQEKGPWRPMRDWDLEDFRIDPMLALEEIRYAGAERDAIMEALQTGDWCKRCIFKMFPDGLVCRTCKKGRSLWKFDGSRREEPEDV